MADSGMWASIRNGTWLTGQRLAGYPRLFLGLYALAALGWMLVAHGGIDPNGTPVGADFIGFWGASYALLHHGAVAVYDAATLTAGETAALGHPVGFYAFFYPPVALLLVAPLALLPYAASLIVWIAVQVGFALAIIRRTLIHRLTTRLLLAFPATFLTVFGGQNALLSAGLIGLGLLLLRRRPGLAGAVFALLLYKPHLGLMIPVALLAGRQWRALAGGVAMAAALTGITLLAFGPETWAAFLGNSRHAGDTLNLGLVDWGKMASVYAGSRKLGLGSAVAWGLQGLVMAGTAATVARVWHRPGPFAAKAATLATATLLATPFLLDYDLTILAVTLAWIVQDRLDNGFRPYEATFLAACWVFPMLVRLIGLPLGLPIAPFFLIGLLIVAARPAAVSDL